MINPTNTVTRSWFLNEKLEQQRASRAIEERALIEIENMRAYTYSALAAWKSGFMNSAWLLRVVCRLRHSEQSRTVAVSITLRVSGRVEHIPTLAIAIPYIPDCLYSNTRSIAIKIEGIIEAKYPTENPWIMLVAAPAVEAS